MTQDRSVGVVNGGKQAICSTLEVHIEYRVYGRNNEIKALQDFSGVVQTPIGKDIRFDAFEDSERSQFLIERIDFGLLLGYFFNL